MCLYPKLIPNRRYLPTKKNGIGKLVVEIDGVELDNDLKKRTIDNKVKESALTLQNLMAEILLKGSQKKVNEEQAKAIPAEILQGWEKLVKEGKGLIIQKEQMEAYVQDVMNRYELGCQWWLFVLLYLRL